MRAPFQILAIPYRKRGSSVEFCVLHRSDIDQWQFIAGGGEDDEKPPQSAKREIHEETGVQVDTLMPLSSMCHIPASIFPDKYLKNWAHDTYVVPEYSFAFKCISDIVLSHEHIECAWLPYDEACKKLKWDSNRTALYELKCRLEKSYLNPEVDLNHMRQVAKNEVSCYKVSKMDIEICKLTPDFAEDYVRFFDTTQHNEKWHTKCYCVCWCGNEPAGVDCSTEEKRRALAIQFVKNGNLQGYLAYSNGQVVGWVNANTKSDCLTCGGWRYLMGSVPTGESADMKVKSIFCFTIAPEMRHKGIATRLLDRVCQDAAQDGFHFVEAYPNKVITAESENFGGFTEMYKKLGFTVYEELESIYVMRKKLSLLTRN